MTEDVSCMHTEQWISIRTLQYLHGISCFWLGVGRSEIRPTFGIFPGVLWTFRTAAERRPDKFDGRERQNREDSLLETVSIWALRLLKGHIC